MRFNEKSNNNITDRDNRVHNTIQTYDVLWSVIADKGCRQVVYAEMYTGVGISLMESCVGTTLPIYN